jgi:hypothetical protein
VEPFSVVAHLQCSPIIKDRKALSTMPEHLPEKFAAQLSSKLATRSRHVCAFLGAGIARACGLPDLAQLQEQVMSSLEPDERDAFEHQLKGGNLEGALTRIRRIAALVGEEVFEGLTETLAKKLDAAVCKAIIKARHQKS